MPRAAPGQRKPLLVARPPLNDGDQVLQELVRAGDSVTLYLVHCMDIGACIGVRVTRRYLLSASYGPGMELRRLPSKQEIILSGEE